MSFNADLPLAVGIIGDYRELFDYNPAHGDTPLVQVHTLPSSRPPAGGYGLPYGSPARTSH